jgi:hypothetical protein
MAKHNHGHGDLVTQRANLTKDDNHQNVVYIFKLNFLKTHRVH